MMFSTDFSMNAIQPPQRFGFIMRHLDAGNAQGETVDDFRQRA
jgi:hypothetical protein